MLPPIGVEMTPNSLPVVGPGAAPFKLDEKLPAWRRDLPARLLPLWVSAF